MCWINVRAEELKDVFQKIASPKNGMQIQEAGIEVQEQTADKCLKNGKGIEKEYSVK